MSRNVLVEKQDRNAVAWQVAVAAYMQLVSWVPLGRWNYQPCCQTGLELLARGTLSTADVVGTVAYLLPAAFFVSGVALAWRSAMWVAVLATAVWLGLQLWSWWLPYLFGASDQWASVYARAFAQSTPILPRWGNHLPPDAMHFVLQFLLVGSVLTAMRALVHRSHAA